MNNLPLQPLKWEDRENSAMVTTMFRGYWVTSDTESKDKFCVYYGSSTGEPARGFASIADAKHWAEYEHYAGEMQPYVKPSPTWISVDDGLPNELKTVLIIYEASLNLKPRKFMTFALREGGDWLGIDDIFGGYVFDDEYNADKFNDDLHGFNITHWMPIPEFSKQGG